MGYFPFGSDWRFFKPDGLEFQPQAHKVDTDTRLKIFNFFYWSKSNVLLHKHYIFKLLH